MYEGIVEIKILREDSSTSGDNRAQDKVNHLLKEGWILLNISTHAPQTLPGEYSKDNNFVYHFGKKSKTTI